MKYAIVDIGTNSVRYMLAEFINNKISVLHTAKSTTRLGEGLYTSEHRLSEGSMMLTVNAVNDFSRHAKANDADKIIATATSAVRDSSNSKELTDAIFAATGITLRILSGNEEALCGFTGAVGNDAYEDTLLIDIGGGSTELITKQSGKIEGISYQCGCVRLNELFKRDFAKAKEFAESMINVPASKHPVWIGGTASAAAMIYLGLSEYDIEKVHNTVIPKEYISKLTEKCINMPINELLELCRFDAKRGEILPYGLIVISYILEKTGADAVTVSEKGLMDGVIMLGIE